MMLPVHVITPEQAEQVDLVICVPLGSPTPYTDNETGECSVCGCAIIFRPHAPKRPPKICTACARGMMGTKH